MRLQTKFLVALFGGVGSHGYANCAPTPGFTEFDVGFPLQPDMQAIAEDEA